MKRSRIHYRERGSLALVEEASALLRNAPLQVHAAYLIGSFPFIVALLFFWTDMSRGAFAQQRLVTGAFGLAVLFVWMKLWQAHYAAGLRGHLESAAVAPLTLRRGMRVAAQQAFIHGIGLFLLPVSLLLVVPFVWTYTFLQNASVYGDGDGDTLRDIIRRAWRRAAYWPLQNHYIVWMASPLLMMLTCAVLLVLTPFVSEYLGGLGLLFLPILLLFMVLISPISLIVALNGFVLILLLPLLLRILLGVDTVFSQGLFGLFNSTTLATTAALTYLVLDPLMKAVYVLRCFYAESIATGADIRSALARFAVVALCLGSVIASASPAVAAPGSSGDAFIAGPVQLDQAIDEEIQRAEYAWRLPRGTTAPIDEASWLGRLGAKIQSWLGLLFDKADWLRRLFEGLFPDPEPGADRSWGGGWAITLRLLFYAAVGLLLITLVVAVVRLLKTRSRPAAIEDTPVLPLAPDLEDEELAADALPEDEWMHLARDFLHRGDVRLAIRACFLAGLAHLARAELVNIRTYKSNREYLRELERRAHAHPELPGAFRSGMDAFECVWYGDREATETRFQQLDAAFQRMKQSC